MIKPPPRSWHNARLISEDEFQSMDDLSLLDYVAENDLRHFYIMATGEPIEVNWECLHGVAGGVWCSGCGSD